MTIAILLYSILSFSQVITGKWYEIAELREDKKINFTFNIENTENKYVTTLEITTQRVSGLKPQKTSFKMEHYLLMEQTLE